MRPNRPGMSSSFLIFTPSTILRGLQATGAAKSSSQTTSGSRKLRVLVESQISQRACSGGDVMRDLRATETRCALSSLIQCRQCTSGASTHSLLSSSDDVFVRHNEVVAVEGTNEEVLQNTCLHLCANIFACCRRRKVEHKGVLWPVLLTIPLRERLLCLSTRMPP